MTALLSGELVVVDDCLRVKSSTSDANYLAVWPPDVRLHSQGELIQIRTEAGRIVAQVGDEIRLSGGEVTSQEALAQAEQLRQEWPAACAGPYWIVGTVVTS